MEKNVVFLFRSGGKDSAMAFHEIQTNPQYSGYRVRALLTTLTEGYDRISGHGVRRVLLERQAAALGLDLHKTYIPKQSTMEKYESVMEEALLRHKGEGTNFAATGDIFVDKRRVSTFQRIGLRGCFPLWKRDRHEQIRVFLGSGFRAYVVCVDSAVLDRSFVGRKVDEEFVYDLPVEIDPCGENGEFHTFVFDGPIFRERIPCKLGEVVFREGFYFSDVLPDA